MALKPPPLAEVLQQLGEAVGNPGFKAEADKTARALAQSALGKLDLVTREEFDAQAAILARTRSRVAALEAELAELTRSLDEDEGSAKP